MRITSLSLFTNISAGFSSTRETGRAPRSAKVSVKQVATALLLGSGLALPKGAAAQGLPGIGAMQAAPVRLGECPPDYETMHIRKTSGFVDHEPGMNCRAPATLPPIAKSKCEQSQWERVSNYPAGTFARCENIMTAGCETGGSIVIKGFSYTADTWICVPPRQNVCATGFSLQALNENKRKEIYVTAHGGNRAKMEQAMADICRRDAMSGARTHLPHGSYGDCDRVQLLRDWECNENLFNQHQCGEFVMREWYCIPE